MQSSLVLLIRNFSLGRKMLFVHKGYYPFISVVQFTAKMTLNVLQIKSCTHLVRFSIVTVVKSSFYTLILRKCRFFVSKIKNVANLYSLPSYLSSFNKF